MAKVNAPLLSFDAHGTLGKKLTYTKARGINYARARNVPTGEPSPQQIERRAAYAAACQAWQALTPEEKEGWMIEAAPLGITGFNAFISYTLLNPAPAHRLLTRSELGAVGRYISLGNPSALNNLGPCTWMSYHKADSSGQGNAGYVFGKTPAGSVTGPRLFATTGQTMTFGTDATSGTNGSPYRTPALVSYPLGSWVHAAVHFTRSAGYATAIQMFTDSLGDLTPVASYAAQSNGAGSIIDDTSRLFYILNRPGIDRAFVGSVAWLACWSGLLELEDMQSIIENGPLSHLDGMVLCFADGEDLGPNELPVLARTTAVDGDMPPNLILGPAA